MTIAVIGALATGVAVEARAQAQRRLEAIYAVEAGKSAVRFRVSSNGCTKKDDFRVQASGQRPHRVTLQRRTPDRCRAFAMGLTWLAYGYDELRIRPDADFVLANPLTAWTGPGD